MMYSCMAATPARRWSALFWWRVRRGRAARPDSRWIPGLLPYAVLEVAASESRDEHRGFGMSIELRIIGFVRTDAEELPRHWSVSDVEGTLDIDEQYSEGLRDIEPGQRIVVIFNFHRSPVFSPEFLRQTSGRDGSEMGYSASVPPSGPTRSGCPYWRCWGSGART